MRSSYNVARFLAPAVASLVALGVSYNPATAEDPKVDSAPRGSIEQKVEGESKYEGKPILKFLYDFSKSAGKSKGGAIKERSNEIKEGENQTGLSHITSLTELEEVLGTKKWDSINPIYLREDLGVDFFFGKNLLEETRYISRYLSPKRSLLSDLAYKDPLKLIELMPDEVSKSYDIFSKRELSKEEMEQIQKMSFWKINFKDKESYDLSEELNSFLALNDKEMRLLTKNLKKDSLDLNIKDTQEIPFIENPEDILKGLLQHIADMANQFDKESNKKCK
ncbi:hypothetical protein CMI42_04570 [Candidatus Pacearchaeota archaeon]|nr:hypothetical protein [Candidatus Pacearchaeota archaeon]